MSYSAHAVQWNGKGDDNRGLIYGIEYMDDDEVSDVEWFKSARIRDGVLELYLKDLKTFGADDAMTSAEFAKLMGAYPEPAGNPSPAYGGFMDNSAANFSWVQNNDYFGAESKKGWSCKYCGHNRKTTHQHRNPNPTLADEVCSKCGVNADYDGELGEHYGAETLEDQCKECSAVEGGEIDGCDECNITIPYNGRYYRQESMSAETNAEEPSFECDLCGKSKHKKIQNKNGQIFYYCTNEEPDGNGCVWGDTAEGKWMMDGKMYYNGMVVGIKNPESAYLTNNCGGCGSSFSVSDEEPGEDGDILCSNCSSEFNADEMMMSIMSKCPDCQSKNMEHFVTDYCQDCAASFNAETFEAQAKTGHEITTSGGKGSFYLPMKDYSKEHAQMLFKDWKPSAYPYEKRITQDTKNDYCANCEKENVHYQFYLKQSNSRRPDMRFVNGASYCKYDENECGANLCNVCADDNDCENCGAEICIDCADKSERIDNSKICVDCREYDASFDAEYGLTPTDQINNSIGVAVPMADPLGLPEDLIAIQAGGVINGVPAEEFYAEMDLVTDGMVAITNTNDDTVGVIEVMDDKDDDEMVEISIQNENLEEIGAFTLDDGMVLDNQDDYLAEMKKPSLLALALGVGAVLLGGSLLKDKLVKNADNDIQEVLENDPELIENPNIGDLSPADYEELVVESTGYAVDVIPMSLDGSFMGSRFAALPTERYVEYNDPGIGAHIDVALNRDEDFLEPEMAMVQAAEDVKEAQAPGQSPYLSVDGQEPKDFSYRVLKETHPVSLDPAVVPFIPQSMAGYTGNANRPPSVYNKMFNLGVLGQTPLFVPGNNDDIGASHTGSRRATPSKMGSIGGPLSDAVNASYTDGQTSKSLAQWSIENSVQQTSDTEAMVIDRSSGNTKRIRRV